MAADELSIETPEQVELTLEPAGLGGRFVAWVLDALLKMLILLGLAVLSVLFVALAGADLMDSLKGYYLALVLVVVFGLLMAYDVYFEVRHNGQTPGKKHQGLRCCVRAAGRLTSPRRVCAGCWRRPTFCPPFTCWGRCWCC